MRLTTAVAEDFDGFYTAHFRDTVAMTYTLTADLGEAQDITQEAFCRAWRRWPHIRGYENPVAWVRHVAANLARSRWRRMKMASARLAGRPDQEVPELNPDHVAVVAALRKLPARYREALVMHHMMDLPVAEVAQHFEVPVGTVKSWLHRGREALAGDLRVDVTSTIATPPAAEIKQRARRQARTRVAVASALAFVVAATGTVLLLRGSQGEPPVPPAITPSPSPSTVFDPSDPMARIDWEQTPVTFPSLGGCPAGQMRLVNTNGAGTVVSAGNVVVGEFATGRFAVGDLNGDGRAEAAIPMLCHPRTQLIPNAFELAVFERHDDGTLHLIAITRGGDQPVRAIWVDMGLLHVWTVWYPSRDDHFGELVSYRLDAGSLTRTGKPSYPAFTSVDLTPVADRLACGQAPVEPDLRLDFVQLKARAGGRELTILPPEDDQSLFMDRGRPGPPYLFLKIGCRSVDVTEWQTSDVVFDLVDGEWLAATVS